METENDLFIEDDETNSRAIFSILLGFGIVSIVFFSLCLIYGIVYFILDIIKSM